MTVTGKTDDQPLLSHLSEKESEALCAQLRSQLLEHVSHTGGHLASNLGVVELTVAIHRVFDTRHDRLVFDVGHQCYPHKLLTGRRDEMNTLRQFDGLSGFPKPKESIHDAFIAGHASNSVAVALGMARARAVLGEDYKVISLIGDGALTGGLAYEGLSNGGKAGGQLLVILNDNGMSITPNVGGVADHLARQRLKPQYLTIKRYYRTLTQATWLGRKLYRVTHQVKKALKQSLLPCSMFENMGFYYLGPVDGHNLAQLTKILTYAKELNEPALLHVRTVKGKGFPPAEENPDAFHGVGPFNPETGAGDHPPAECFSTVFGRKLAQLGRDIPALCAITAAMSHGTGLEEFEKSCPERFFDVGIAEGCAVSMAAGMAKQGAIPVFGVYSTFLQRGYDMLLHDVAIDGLHVVLGVDRAGLVGEDGETHHGLFDVSFLDSIPGMTVLAPSSFSELEDMLTRAVREIPGPVALRFPRGGEGGYRHNHARVPAVVLRAGKDITLTGYGMMINQILAAAEQLHAQGIEAEVVKLNTITPLSPHLVLESVRKTGRLLVAEDCIASGSVGQRLAAALEAQGQAARVRLLNCGAGFITHGTVNQLLKLLYLDSEGIARTALEVMRNG